MGYLDTSGLSYFWGKIKAALGGKQDKENAVTAPGSGTLSMSETLGDGPYTIEFTEEADPEDINASSIAYDNTESGMTATNVQDAITELNAAPKGGPGVPAGSVFWLAAQTAPEGYLICDGSAVSRTEYADLFAVIGTTFGAGDGSTTFALPDLRAKFVRGAGSSNGYSATFGQTQEGTFLSPVASQPASGSAAVPVVGYSDKQQSVSLTNQSVYNWASSTTTSANNNYFRPYNIALTPIIKY